jgi:hypothetical protein
MVAVGTGRSKNLKNTEKIEKTPKNRCFCNKFGPNKVIIFKFFHFFSKIFSRKKIIFTNYFFSLGGFMNEKNLKKIFSLWNLVEIVLLAETSACPHLLTLW